MKKVAPKLPPMYPLTMARPTRPFPFFQFACSLSRPTKDYPSGPTLTVLRDVSFEIPQGAFVPIGPPQWENTLLGLLAGLDTPSRGTVMLMELTWDGLMKISELRSAVKGRICFRALLIPTLTAIEMYRCRWN